jgi:hypothetical protein
VGAYAERLDEQIFDEGMLDRIFNQISKSDVIVADMTRRNANVFYEVGYAHALGKVTLLVTQDSDDIPFDLKHRQHIVYGGKINQLRQELGVKLRWGIQEARARQSGEAPEQFEVRFFDCLLVEGIDLDPVPEIVGATASSLFFTPLVVRNDGLDSLQAISHVYLFGAGDGALTPAKEYPSYFGIPTFGEASMATQTQHEPIQSYPASPADAPDGLNQQFRLPVAFGVIPPGANETDSLAFLFKKGMTQCDAPFRLRLHTAHRYYDYRFRLRLTLRKDDNEEDA